MPSHGSVSRWLTGPGRSDVVEVEVLKLGTQRSARVLVRYVDGRFEGRQEWVPPSRLKVRCAAVDTFREREAS